MLCKVFFPNIDLQSPDDSKEQTEDRNLCAKKTLFFLIKGTQMWFSNYVILISSTALWHS